jgi:hypothetical protein
MPKFLEDQLKAEYGKDSAVPYKIMNKVGAMHGNKETAKGRAMERKHVRDTRPHIDRGHTNVKNADKHAGKLKHG